MKMYEPNPSGLGALQAYISGAIVVLQVPLDSANPAGNELIPG